MLTDKRVLKTRARIKNAFMELSLEMDMSRISVSAIAEKAQINRSTFYLHYKEVCDVADEIDKFITNSISSCIESFDFDDLYGSSYSMFNELTAALDKDEPLKKYITQSKNAYCIEDKLKSIFIEKALKSIKQYSPDCDPNNALFPLTFAAAGIVECYMKWERSGGEVPLDKIITQSSEILNYILKNLNI